MKRAETTLRLTLAALGVVALLGAGAAAGVDRSTEMMNAGISPDHLQTGYLQNGAALLDDVTVVEDSIHVD